MKYILCILLLIFLIGCEAPAGITPATTKAPPVTEDSLAPVISPMETEPPTISVSQIELRFHSLSLRAGDDVCATATVYPEDAADKTLVWTTSDPAVAMVDEAGNITAVGEGDCTVTVSSADNPAVTEQIAVTVTGTEGCLYLDGVLIVNKSYALPETYGGGMDRDAFSHLCEMFNAAKAAGHTLFVKSDYRSYYDQRYIYNGYVARDGKEAADRYSARPGHSEHQSGLAFDLNELSYAFGESPEGIWLAENCHKYGFILRYPRDKEALTGYMYEPWHVRYIGAELSTLVYESGLCLEEYFGIPSVYGEE